MTSERAFYIIFSAGFLSSVIPIFNVVSLILLRFKKRSSIPYVLFYLHLVSTFVLLTMTSFDNPSSYGDMAAMARAGNQFVFVFYCGAFLVNAVLTYIYWQRQGKAKKIGA